MRAGEPAVVGWQRIEGAIMGLAGIALAVLVGAGGWWVWLMLIAPDLAMFGYLAGPRVGAAAYNAAHLYASGMILALIGVAGGSAVLIAAGALWVAHVGIDRALGYGLKSPAGFQETHLGRIGRD